MSVKNRVGLWVSVWGMFLYFVETNTVDNMFGILWIVVGTFFLFLEDK